MDILNNSNILNGGSGSSTGSCDVLKSNNANNFALDSDSSSHSFNSISSTPNSLISTPSPSSSDNNSIGNLHNNLSQTSTATNDFGQLLQQYSLLSNNGTNNNVDSLSHYFNPDSGNNILNGYLHDLNYNNHLNNYNAGKNIKDNSSNSMLLTAAGSSHKKQTSNINTSSGANSNSKKNGTNATIPPGLGPCINKSSPVANGQAMNSNKPKNLRTLMNNNIMNSNNKMRLTNGDMGNKFPDGLYSLMASGSSLNNLPPQMLQQQQSPSFNSFQLPNSENFDLSFNRSNNFLSSGLNPINSSSWLNMKSGGETSSSAFDELLSGASPFKGSDAPILSPNGSSSNSSTKFGMSQANPAGEIGSGAKTDSLNSNLDSFLAGLALPKREGRDIWLHGNEPASSNSQMGAFYNSIHSQDIITSASSAVNPVTAPTSNASANMFENTWSPSNSSNGFNTWNDAFSLRNLPNDSVINLESRNGLNMPVASDFDLKKLINNNEKLSSILDNQTPFDMKGRTQLNDILTMFKKYIFEIIISHDLHLCQNNFDHYFAMLRSDLAKFEASTFTIEELKIFREIYNNLIQGQKQFAEEKRAIDENYQQFNLLIKNLLISSASSSVYMFDDDLLRKVADKLVTTFNVLYSEKHNNIFLNLVKFYKKMIYSIPTEILNNLPIIIQQSKLMTENGGHSADPLQVAYRNFIIELNKHSQNRNTFPNSHEADEADSVDEMVPDRKNSQNSSSDIHSENKDVNNNKKTDTSKDFNQPSEKESEFKLKQAKLSCNNNQPIPPIFSNVTQVKSDISVYMPFYYPIDHNMLNLNGPISIFCNRIKVKAPYYLSPNRQTFDFIVDGELTKVLPGPIVLERSENLTTNKSFNKLIARLKKHFPNLSIKQLVDLTLQSKYAIMKKHKLQYGFSGFKMRDLVRYIAEYIYDNAIVSNMHGGNSAAAAALAAKGVSWSKVASASNITQPNGQVIMSPSTSGAKDSASVVSSNASPSPSPSLSSNPSTSQLCALCQNIITSTATDEKRKLALIACSHVFHKECIDFWTKINPACPKCDQFILRNEEFPSL